MTARLGRSYSNPGARQGMNKAELHQQDSIFTSCLTVIDDRLASDMTCLVRSDLHAIEATVWSVALQVGSR